MTPPAGWSPRRGEVYLVQMDKLQAALILSTDILNRHALDVCVVPITTVHRGAFSLRVPLTAGEGGLESDSWAKCDQVTTLEKSRLSYPALGRLSVSALHRIEGYVKAALQLP